MSWNLIFFWLGTKKISSGIIKSLNSHNNSRLFCVLLVTPWVHCPNTKGSLNLVNCVLKRSLASCYQWFSNWCAFGQLFWWHVRTHNGTRHRYQVVNGNKIQSCIFGHSRDWNNVNFIFIHYFFLERTIKILLVPTNPSSVSTLSAKS